MGIHLSCNVLKLALILAACSATAVRSESLVFVASSTVGEDMYVDRDTMITVPPTAQRRFSAVRIWAVNQVRAGRRTPARTERFQFSFNCTARTSTILAFRNNRPGIRLQDWQAADLAHKYELPRSGSLAELAMIFACSGGKLPIIPRPDTNTGDDSDEGPDGTAS
jgi:hypothetical protein